MNATTKQLEYLATRVRVMDRLLIKADAQRTMLLTALEDVDKARSGTAEQVRLAWEQAHAAISKVKGSR